MSTKVVTGKVRFSYANVWEPTSIEEGQPKKYNISILVPKKDKKEFKDIITVVSQIAIVIIGVFTTYILLRNN